MKQRRHGSVGLVLVSWFVVGKPPAVFECTVPVPAYDLARRVPQSSSLAHLSDGRALMSVLAAELLLYKTSRLLLHHVF